MKLNELFAHTLNIPPSRVTEEMTMQNTAEWDSLKHIELIVAIEGQYNIELTGDEIAVMTSYQTISDMLQKRGVA